MYKYTLLTETFKLFTIIIQRILKLHECAALEFFEFKVFRQLKYGYRYTCFKFKKYGPIHPNILLCIFAFKIFGDFIKNFNRKLVPSNSH